MKKTLRLSSYVLLMLMLAACATSRTATEKPEMGERLVNEMRVTLHRDGDDLLSAGLGLSGLRGGPPTFNNSANPTADELRKRAIYSSWRGIADLSPLGGYGEIYGAVPVVVGREFTSFAFLEGARSPHRVLVQVPDLFDRDRRCVVVTASSGSRGIYGAISLAGAWGLPRGCAVAYTDKGAGSGYFDMLSNTGVALDSTRAERGSALLEFEPFEGETPAETNPVLIKHAHSGDNPEADWGRHVRQAAQFALRALDDAFPEQAPFTPENTRIIATGLSNGGGAVLRAAESDDGLIDGVVAVEPNIAAGQGGRALYDYVTEAALLAPCALLDSRFDQTPFARVNGAPHPGWVARCNALHEQGVLTGADTVARAREAYERMRGTGWTDAALASAAASTGLDLWRAIAVTYSAAYTRTGVGAMPCGYGMAAFDAKGFPQAAPDAQRATWWADTSGIAPGGGVGLVDLKSEGVDPSLPGLLCLRELWTDPDAIGRHLHVGIEAMRAKLPREELPILIVHGVDDGLIPMAFSSDPYVQWLEQNQRKPTYWRVANAQHFDAFLAFPGFGERYVPLMPYAYAALDHLLAHLTSGAALPKSRDIATTPRGDGPLGANQLGEILRD